MCVILFFIAAGEGWCTDSALVLFSVQCHSSLCPVWVPGPDTTSGPKRNTGLQPYLHSVTRDGQLARLLQVLLQLINSHACSCIRRGACAPAAAGRPSCIMIPASRRQRRLTGRVCGACSGLTARSMSAFQAAGWFGYAGYPPSAVPWQNRPLWDWTRCCSTANNKFFALLGALFGYTVRPFFCYCSQKGIRIQGCAAVQPWQPGG